MKWLPNKKTSARSEAIFAIYAQLAKAARCPSLFVDYGVPDTFDGRFDVLILHVGLMVARLSGEDQDNHASADLLSRDLASAFVADMDRTVREMGIGDLSVGKQVKSMSRALYGRAAAYHESLVTGDREGLELALVRNIWGGDGPTDVDGQLDGRVAVGALADYVLEFWTAVNAVSLEKIMGGHISGLPVPVARANPNDSENVGRGQPDE